MINLLAVSTLLGGHLLNCSFLLFYSNQECAMNIDWITRFGRGRSSHVATEFLTSHAVMDEHVLRSHISATFIALKNRVVDLVRGKLAGHINTYEGSCAPWPVCRGAQGDDACDHRAACEDGPLRCDDSHRGHPLQNRRSPSCFRASYA